MKIINFQTNKKKLKQIDNNNIINNNILYNKIIFKNYTTLNILN